LSFFVLAIGYQTDVINLTDCRTVASDHAAVKERCYSNSEMTVQKLKNRSKPLLSERRVASSK
jgi:hypothetical protein